MDSPLNLTLGARMSAYLTTSEDFKKQRKRLNKNLVKLRHELDLITKDTTNYKNKEKISSISSKDYEKNDKYAILLLWTAERDMLYALEIKTMMENDMSASYKNLMISKIKKSLSTAKKVLEITASEKSDLKKIELYTYAALIQGHLSISKKQWAVALNAYSVAKCSLDFLYSQLNRDQDDELSFSKTLIQELMETVVDPSLNLAISQEDSLKNSTRDVKTFSRQHCHDDKLPYLQNVISIIERLDPSFVSELSASVELIKSVKWRNHEANLYNDEIAFKLLTLTNDEITNWKLFSDANQFDLLITGWSDALELHQVDTEKNQDDDELEKVQERAILLTYINYNLLFTRLKRDLLIIDQLSTTNVYKNKDISRLYSGIIAITQELKDLPGVYNDEDLFQSLESLEKFFNAKKTSVLAESFEFNNKFAEALKIFTYIQNELLSSSESFYKIDEFPYAVTNNKELVDFKKEVEEKLLQAHISAQFSHEISVLGKSYTVEHMDEYPAGDLSELLNLNAPKIQPLLSKPVLFDVGFNYINYEPTKSTLAAPSTPITTETTTAQSEENKKRGGFFGIFGGRT
jgi:signal recognition particle subunit SRP68